MKEFVEKFIRILQGFGVEQWAALFAIIATLCGGILFVIRLLYKKLSCPICATIQSLYVHEFDEGIQYVFKILIQNRKNNPISISKIQLKRDGKFFQDPRNDEALVLQSNGHQDIIQTFLLPVHAKDCVNHSFVFYIGKNKYSRKLYSRICNK